MPKQPGFWSVEDRLRELSAQGDPLEKLQVIVCDHLNRPVLAPHGSEQAEGTTRSLTNNASYKGLRSIWTLRHSFDTASATSSLHMVSAWECEQRLVLAQRATNAKSNETAVVPKLLDMLSLNGTIVTVDAMNCQRAIARRIIDKGGDDVFARKANQETLYDDVRRFLDDPDTAAVERHTIADGDHGWIEIRAALVSTNIAWLQDIHHWPGSMSSAR